MPRFHMNRKWNGKFPKINLLENKMNRIARKEIKSMQKKGHKILLTVVDPFNRKISISSYYCGENISPRIIRV
jgi:hypothetical protein